MPATRLSLRPLFLFLALLWLGATFIYFGDTGKHSDDYWAASRTIERAEIDWSSNPWQHWPYFWRPLHLAHVWAMNTIFWRHDWVMHLELALVHGAVCLLLFRLLMRLGSARGPALAAALLDGTNPLLGEAIGWSSASCNAIGSLLMLITLHLGWRVGSSLSDESPAPFSAAALRGLTIIFLASFATACFYEPAAAALAAIPIVVWTASPRNARLASRLRITALATLSAGAACILYAALLIGTAPSNQRGAAETILSLRSLPDNALALAHSLLAMFFGPKGRDIVLGSIEHGLGTAIERPFVLAVILATSIAGMFAFSPWRQPHTAVPRQDTAAPQPRGQFLLIGVILMTATWIPFIAQHTRNFDVRSLYVPLMGVAFLTAALGNAFSRGIAVLPERRRRASSAIATIAVGLLVIAGQIGLVGVQTLFRANARNDALVAAQLAAMSPHIEPGTVFVFLATGHRGAATSRPIYNGSLHTALEAPWCATPFLQRSMHRRDIQLITTGFWSRRFLAIDTLTAETVRETGLGVEGRLVAWSSIVPLWIDSHARVHIIETLTLQPLDAAPIEVRPPRAHRLAQAMPEPPPTPAPASPPRIRLVERPDHKTRIAAEQHAGSQQNKPAR